MRVLFFGNSVFSLPVLEALARADVELVGIVAPLGRAHPWRRPLVLAKRRVLRASLLLPPVARPRSSYAARVLRLARDTGARVFWPSRVNDGRLVERLRELRADVTVMAGFNQILRPLVIDALGPVLNVHPSLLPSYRGPVPQFWIVRNGERESGVTVHLVDHGVDTGPIVAQERFTVEPWLTGGELRDRASAIGGLLVCEVLERHARGRRSAEAQRGPGSYFGRVEPEHLLVAFPERLTVAYDRARAAEPEDGSRAFLPWEWWRGETEHAFARLRPRSGLLEVRLHGPVPFPGFQGGAPGAVLRVAGGGTAIQCSDGALVFQHVSATGA